MNRLALDAASSLLWLLRGVFFPPFLPRFAVFLPSSCLLIPSTVLIAGLSGQEERRNQSLCLGMSHPLAFVYSFEKRSPPLPVLSLGGSWRVARDNHSLIFYLFLLNKASCSLQADFVRCPPHPVLLTLQTASDGPRGRAPVLQQIPLRIPLRENGGFDVGTAPLNVAVGQEGPQAAAKQLWAGNADQYSVLGRGLWKINIWPKHPWK